MVAGPAVLPHCPLALLWPLAVVDSVLVVTLLLRCLLLPALLLLLLAPLLLLLLTLEVFLLSATFGLSWYKDMNARASCRPIA